MRAIKPFCAVRPVASIANEFCTNPLTLYSEEEVKKILKSNSNSFLQIIKNGNRLLKISIYKNYKFL